MEITVKRRTWPIGMLMPVSLVVDDEEIGSLYAYQEKSIELKKQVGTLKYYQPLNRSDQIQVKAGDTVILKETKLSWLSNILFIITALYHILMAPEIFGNGYLNHFNWETSVALALLIVLVILAVLSFFLNSYKFVIENHSSKE